MTRIRYKEILARLAEFDPWLDSMGIPVKNDRIHHAIEVVRRAQEGVDRLRETGQPAKIGNVEDYYAGIIEALELYSIFCAFHLDSSANMREKILRALNGPSRPQDETPQNTDGRNTMFELALAAEWCNAGLGVALGDPDIALKCEEIPYYVECKRPFRADSIRPNVRDAIHQLRTKLDRQDHLNGYGVIAISTSKIFNPGNRVFIAPTEDGRGKLGDVVEELMRGQEKGWVRYERHERTVAVLFHVATASVIQNQDLLARMTYTVLMPIGLEGDSFRKLGRVLRPLYET